MTLQEVLERRYEDTRHWLERLNTNSEHWPAPKGMTLRVDGVPVADFERCRDGQFSVRRIYDGRRLVEYIDGLED